ncbi:MAG: hypothetical protein AAF766_24085 [Cyanobacteria bacterium P01_D01_bin.14]
MSANPDRLYSLLPAVYRQRDGELGEPLRSLLQVISEQVDVVEADIDQLYRNWFIETCEDWVIPYIADLIGYQPVAAAGQLGAIDTPQGQARNRVLVPRREVANTIRYRRRKGTLALLECLAQNVAGWPARAVEFYKLLGWTQALNHLNLDRGRTVDLRQGQRLDRLNGPFDILAHTVDVRSIASKYEPGRHNLPSVGLFVWRLKAYSVTKTPAYCLEEVGSHCYTFSVLGNDTPLYTKAVPETDPTDIAGALNVPMPIWRSAFEARGIDAEGTDYVQASATYYGAGKSLAIWAPGWQESTQDMPIPASRILPADLSDWQYRPRPGFVAVDPELGRIAFPPSQLPQRGVVVNYHYGLSAGVGGGEYDRALMPFVGNDADTHQIYQVQQPFPGSAGADLAIPTSRVTQATTPTGVFSSISAAIAQWQIDQPQQARIEILDSGVYVEQINLEVGANQTLQIRAANRQRPVLRLLNWYTAMPDAINVTLQPGSHFWVDGLMITGRGMRVRQAIALEDSASPQSPVNAPGQPPALPELKAHAYLTIRHSTLVPGWTLDCNCAPRRPTEPSLELSNLHGKVTIEHSIVGSLQVNQNEVQTDPVAIQVRDSVLDATASDLEAIGAPGHPVAHASLHIIRSTVFGQVQVHAIELAENSIFDGHITVARSQIGCMRFCAYLKGSRTPRRFRCQPDLAIATLKQQFQEMEQPVTPTALAAAEQRECNRVQPRFNSTRYGTPAYCQLAHHCPLEITRGADDESEMGVFHHLYQPQRAANLQARLDEYTPAGMKAAILYAS